MLMVMDAGCQEGRAWQRAASMSRRRDETTLAVPVKLGSGVILTSHPAVLTRPGPSLALCWMRASESWEQSGHDFSAGARGLFWVLLGTEQRLRVNNRAPSAPSWLGAQTDQR